MATEGDDAVRLDLWLWAARFFKTRRLAADAIKGGKVTVNGAKGKPAKEVRAGQRIAVTKGAYEFVVAVDDVADKRGPAAEAEKLYTETAESVERRQQVKAQQRSVAAAMPHTDHRPDRRDRRQLARFKRERGG
jgi:ribosome-associated heat shock protein Hsp15